MKNNWRLGLGYALTTALMWGLLPLALKGLLVQMDPITITWYRFVGSLLIALLWYGHRSGRAVKNLLSRQNVMLTLLATVGLLVNYLLYLFGLNFITPSASQIVIQLAPLLLLIGSIYIFKESFSTVQWLGVLTLVVGMLLFFHHRLSTFFAADPSVSNDNYALGILLIVAAGVTWSIYGLAQKRLVQIESSNDFLLIIYFAGTICYLPFATPSQVFDLNSLQLSLLTFTSLNTIIAYGCFGLALTHWEGSRVSAVITLSPLLTMIFVSLFDQWRPGVMDIEPMNLLSWMGALMVVSGSIVAALAKKSSTGDLNEAPASKIEKVA